MIGKQDSLANAQHPAAASLGFRCGQTLQIATQDSSPQVTAHTARTIFWRRTTARRQDPSSGDPQARLMAVLVAAAVVAIITTLLVTADRGSVPGAILVGGVAVAGTVGALLSALRYLRG